MTKLISYFYGLPQAIKAADDERVQNEKKGSNLKAEQWAKDKRRKRKAGASGGGSSQSEDIAEGLDNPEDEYRLAHEERDEREEKARLDTRDAMDKNFELLSKAFSPAGQIEQAKNQEMGRLLAQEEFDEEKEGRMAARLAARLAARK